VRILEDGSEKIAKVFSIQTEKGKVWVTAPILAPLARSIEISPIGESTFIAGERRKPFTKESFGNGFREACNAAGVPGAAHGLRKTGATRAAEAGCTERELMSLYGWEDEAMPSIYTEKANRTKMAAAGSLKLGK
ncbi:MAG: tyrosine-type recombinase/integrase, partial [Roseiarcus sp.]